MTAAAAAAGGHGARGPEGGIDIVGDRGRRRRHSPRHHGGLRSRVIVQQSFEGGQVGGGSGSRGVWRGETRMRRGQQGRRVVGVVEMRFRRPEVAGNFAGKRRRRRRRRVRGYILGFLGIKNSFVFLYFFPNVMNVRTSVRSKRFVGVSFLLF